MATCILLASYTDQGVRNIKDTTKRADAFRALAKHMGAQVKDIYWTLGAYDIVAIVEAADESVITALGLALAKSGNVRLQTLKAIAQAEMDAILGKVI